MIWEIRNGGMQEFAVLVSVAQDEHTGMMFFCDGHKKNWPFPPKVMPDIEKRKKKQKPRADISHLWMGAIVLNQRARDALQHILEPFGEMLRLDCEGETEYFYNVTNLVHGIDMEKSVLEHGTVRTEVFLPDLDTAHALIFKDPMTASGRIYANQVATEQIKEVVTREKLTGIKFSEPGSRPY